jgi:hypothetical protein
LALIHSHLESLKLPSKIEFSNRELAEKKFELVYGAATNDWSPRINSVNNILVSLDILAPMSIQIYCSASITSEVLQFLSGLPSDKIKKEDYINFLLPATNWNNNLFYLNNKAK